MKRKIFATIDTNVLVSSFFSSDGTSNPAKIIRYILNGQISLLYSKEIIEEYREVLSRPKFGFKSEDVEALIAFLAQVGIETRRTPVDMNEFPDPDDIVFYEVTMSVDEAYLVTGNLKHFPTKPFIVTPAQMVEIVEGMDRD